MNAFVRDTIPDLKDIHTLIPKISEYVTLQGKRHFADVIHLMILTWEVILASKVGPIQFNHKGFTTG